MRYLVTTELKTHWWRKILIFLNIKKLVTFEVRFGADLFKVGDMISLAGSVVKIIKKIS